MGLKAPSNLSTDLSGFTRQPSIITKPSKITHTVPLSSETVANIRVVFGVTADHSATFRRSANIGVAITASATGLNTGGIELGTAVVSVGITSTASANVTRSGVASVSVGVTSTCTGTLVSASTTHTGTADCQVNIDIAATGLGSNQIPDETANANPMTLNGGATLTDDAAIGTRAVRFDGTNDYGLIDDSFQSTFQSPFSISMWVKPDDGQLEAGQIERLFSTYETLQSTVTLYYLDCFLNEDGDIRWGTHYYNGTSSLNKIRITTSPVFSDGAQSSYKHLIVTVDADGVPTIYIDGSSVALTNWDNDTFTIDGYTNPGTTGTKIGAFASSTSTKFNGKIDDLSIWSTELSSTDVSNLYNSGNGTSLTGSSNLAGWWKMGEGSAMPVTHSGTAVVTVDVTATATGASVAGFSQVYSLAFDGSNDYLNVSGFNPNSLIGTGAMTFSAWFKIDIDSAVQRIMYMGHPTNNEDYLTLFFRNTNNTLELSARSGDAGNAAITGSTTLSTSTWYHAAFTRTGSTCTTYLNGSQEGAVTDSEFSVALGSTFMLGTFKNVASYLDGFLDESAVWDVALDADAVTAIYNSGVPTDLTSDSGNYDNSGDLIGYWRMEENTGTSVADSSTNSNAATLTNGPTFSTDVPVAWSNDYSLSLDGTNDYVDVGNFDISSEIGSGDFTVSLWFKITDTSHHNNMLQWRPLSPSASDDDMFKLQYISTQSKVRFQFRQASGSYISVYHTNTLSQDTWYHLLATRSGTTANIYLDNANNASVTDSNVGHDFTNADHVLGVGDLSGGSTSLEGNLDEYAIWDRVLTSTERATVYNSGVPSDLTSDVSSGLVGYWRFEENTGTSIADSSTNSNTATLTNGPTFSIDTP